MRHNYIESLLENIDRVNFRQDKHNLISGIEMNSSDKYRYFKVDIPELGKTEEVPLFAFAAICRIMSENQLIRLGTLNIPLISDGFVKIANTYPTFEKTWLTYRYSDNYYKCLSLKDNLYYTYPGLILDKNFKTLIYTGVQFTSDVGTGIGPIARRTKLIVYISPSVFNTPNLLCRNLVKKFLPTLQDCIDFPSRIYKDIPIDIMIKERNDLLHTPVAPPNVDVEQHVYNLLDDGVNQIMENLEYV